MPTLIESGSIGTPKRLREVASSPPRSVARRVGSLNKEPVALINLVDNDHVNDDEKQKEKEKERVYPGEKDGSRAPTTAEDEGGANDDDGDETGSGEDCSSSSSSSPKLLDYYDIMDEEDSIDEDNEKDEDFFCHLTDSPPLRTRPRRTTRCLTKPDAKETTGNKKNEEVPRRRRTTKTENKIPLSSSSSSAHVETSKATKNEESTDATTIETTTTDNDSEPSRTIDDDPKSTTLASRRRGAPTTKAMRRTSPRQRPEGNATTTTTTRTMKKEQEKILHASVSVTPVERTKTIPNVLPHPPGHDPSFVCRSFSSSEALFLTDVLRVHTARQLLVWNEETVATELHAWRDRLRDGDAAPSRDFCAGMVRSWWLRARHEVDGGWKSGMPTKVTVPAERANASEAAMTTLKQSSEAVTKTLKQSSEAVTKTLKQSSEAATKTLKQSSEANLRSPVKCISTTVPRNGDRARATPVAVADVRTYSETTTNTGRSVDRRPLENARATRSVVTNLAPSEQSPTTTTNLKLVKPTVVPPMANAGQIRLTVSTKTTTAVTPSPLTNVADRYVPTTTSRDASEKIANPSASSPPALSDVADPIMCEILRLRANVTTTEQLLRAPEPVLEGCYEEWQRRMGIVGDNALKTTDAPRSAVRTWTHHVSKMAAARAQRNNTSAAATSIDSPIAIEVDDVPSAAEQLREAVRVAFLPPSQAPASNLKPANSVANTTHRPTPQAQPRPQIRYKTPRIAQEKQQWDRHNVVKQLNQRRQQQHQQEQPNPPQPQQSLLQPPSPYNSQQSRQNYSTPPTSQPQQHVVNPLRVFVQQAYNPQMYMAQQYYQSAIPPISTATSVPGAAPAPRAPTLTPSQAPHTATSRGTSWARPPPVAPTTIHSVPLHTAATPGASSWARPPSGALTTAPAPSATPPRPAAPPGTTTVPWTPASLSWWKPHPPQYAHPQQQQQHPSPKSQPQQHLSPPSQLQQRHVATATATLPTQPPLPRPGQSAPSHTHVIFR